MMLVLIALLSIAQIAPAQPTTCIALQGDHIAARDFAVSIPGFSKLAPETPLGMSPLPGVRRFFHPAELNQLAKRFEVELGAETDVCFERAMEKLDREKVVESMRQALGLAGARIEILETSLYPVPQGQLTFRREDLGRPALVSAESPVIWRGNVIYGDSHRFSVWAKVLISASVPRVLAVENLKRGEPIASSQIRVETAATFPAAGDVARTVDEVVGRLPVRDIAAGAEVRLGQVIPVPDVNRGEMVDVEVRSGAARLILTGKAETAGRTGDMITVRNPDTNKLFQARVVNKGRAFLDAGRANGR